MKAPLDVSYLHERLEYQPDTGQLFWKDFVNATPQWRAKHAGKEAFVTPAKDGYCKGRIGKKNFLTHRVIWAMHFNEWPTGQIDHINGVKTDNRICNLRVVTNQENLRNQSKRRNNTSGVTGVYWKKSSKKWKAQIMVDGKYLNLGVFVSLADAAKARSEAAKKFGFSDRHGL